MEVTLQALRTMPEENYQVLRFLTDFLVQVRPRLSLCCSPGGGRSYGPAASGSWWPGVAACCSPPIPLCRYLPTVTRTR